MIHHRTVLYDQLTPISIFSRLKDYFKSELSFLLESSINTTEGNFSFIFIGALERITHKDGITLYTDIDGQSKEVDKNPFTFMKRYYRDLDKESYKQKARDLGVAFVDGFLSYIAYDAVKIYEPHLEPYMSNLKDDLQTPDMDLVRPKLTIAFSHKTNKLILMTPCKDFAKELDSLVSYLFEPYIIKPIVPCVAIDNGHFAFSKEQFFEMVDKSLEMIKSGDVFQILMSNRFTQKIKMDPLSFYRALRSKNPSPYLFYLDYHDFIIAGSSPEVMVGLQDGKILLRPIAGTRKRGKTLKRDLELENELLSDTKERAEHLMLVDLGRNDVGRVAKAGSVQVENFMHVERYSHVMHIVSDVYAELDEKYDMFDLFAATFTAGTMTGAPKIRAMELIAEFEGLKRGFYSGAIGYFGFDGNMDSCITIRTSCIKDDTITLQAGAGVVADSSHELEYLEVHNKLAALMSTLEDLQNLS